MDIKSLNVCGISYYTYRQKNCFELLKVCLTGNRRKLRSNFMKEKSK